ncbi:MAG: hypothetical protein ACREM9_07560 [Gemmatimonadales bacterium]
MAASRWLLHPFLFALYFVVTLAAANTNELKGLADLVWPVSISLLVCSFCWLAGYALTRDGQKAAILGLLWFVAFSIFGYVAETLRLPLTLRLIGEEPGLGVLFALALFGPTLAIHRSGRRLKPVNRYLSLVGLCLLGYTTFQLYRGLQRERDRGAVLPLPPVLADRAAMGDRPDIFLIILDKYTGSEVLRQHFGFDNSGFESFLRSRGFVVPKSSQANYPQTPLALASLLNLDYIQNLPPQLHLYDLVEDNRLAAFLKGQGYRFAFFPTGFRITFQNRNADLQLPAPREVRGEFAAVWQNTTMLPELLGGACALIGCEAGRFLVTAQAAELMDWKFERLKDLAGGDRPTFVLAHLSLPHEPYLYHADCSHRDLYWPAGAGLPGDEEANEGYLDQIRCANRKLSALVDSILTRSRRPPVILLQSDHGHGRIGHLPRFEKLNPYQLRERMSVFSAYLLPGLSNGAIGDSVTPVNAVRVVLRHYFGADLPPLEDASFWGLEDRPHDLVRVRW